MVRVFANGPGDLGSIPDQVIPKTQKTVLDASLLNTQHYKVRIKGKVANFTTTLCKCLSFNIFFISMKSIKLYYYPW